MKLFLKEHWSLIALQVIQSFLLLSVIWLAGFRNCSILTYSLLLYFAIFCFYLLYKYMTRRKLYHLLQQTMNHLDDALQKLDYAPISDAVSKILQQQYSLFQYEIIHLKNKQDQHLTFIDRWIHQMKTPLSVLSLIAKDLDEPESSNVREEIDRLQSGLTTVMHMSKLRTIEQDFQIRRVHLPSLLAEINRDLRRLYIRNDVYPNVKKQEEVTIETDEKWLYFIINQIISNAIKYTNGLSKEITFVIYTKDEKAFLEVTDYGVGIPEHDIKRIFSPFYTGENGRYFRESTGVGLYIAKEAISYLAHDIKVSSKVGEGTTFILIFNTYLTNL